MNYADEPEHARQVREYYDLNTGRFLRWGKDEGTRNIHAALWPPEVGSLAAAMNHSNEMVAREIEGCPYAVDRVLDLESVARDAGFHLIEQRDLTPHLRLGRPRDRAIALLVRLLGRRMARTAYLRALAGGDAKQQCYREGLIRYLFLMFENQSADGGR
jgi:hypothetical protein